MKTLSNSTRARSAEPIDLLRHDMAAIKRDVAALVGGGLGAMSDRTKELVEKTKEKAGVVHERLRETAAARPITTIALAVAAGAIGAKLVSWFWRRSG